MGRMDGKVALITGAARGQGRSHATTLAREGADIVAFDICSSIDGIPYALSTPDDLKETVAQVEALDRRIIAVEGDVRKQADLDTAVAEGIAALGKIDVCIANAAIGENCPFWELSEEQWTVMIDVCLNGAWRTAKAVTPHMMERAGGAFVLIGSVGAIEGSQDQGHYVAAKHGLLGLMKNICIELSPTYGIRCNAVLPGPVDTPMIKWQGMLDWIAGGPGLGTLENMNRGVKNWTGMKDVGVLPVEAISNAVLFLSSEESQYVNGLELIVDAGHHVLPGLDTVEFGAQAAEGD
ncbi:MAG: mycofactocin-coupled SDR family oxidoreductase [Pirellulales bacterium]